LWEKEASGKDFVAIANEMDFSPLGIEKYRYFASLKKG